MGICDENRKSRPGIRRIPLLLAIDRSEAMLGGPATVATAGISAFLDQLSPGDRLGFIAFNHKVIRPVPVGPVRDARYLKRILAQIEPRNGADLGNALRTGIHDCLGDPEVPGLVIVSAGRPVPPRRSAERLEDLARTGRDRGVRISMIAVGSEAGPDLPERIARAGGAEFARAQDAAGVRRALDRFSRADSEDQGP